MVALRDNALIGCWLRFAFCYRGVRRVSEPANNAGHGHCLRLHTICNRASFAIAQRSKLRCVRGCAMFGVALRWLLQCSSTHRQGDGSSEENWRVGLGGFHSEDSSGKLPAIPTTLQSHLGEPAAGPGEPPRGDQVLPLRWENEDKIFMASYFTRALIRSREINGARQLHPPSSRRQTAAIVYFPRTYLSRNLLRQIFY